MTTKHTPGPWTVAEETAIDYRPCQIYGADGGSQVAWLAGGGRKRAIDKPEERANARLIAAAPDLLELAREIADNAILAGMEIGQRARAAIAKAEGEQA